MSLNTVGYALRRQMGWFVPIFSAVILCLVLLSTGCASDGVAKANRNVYVYVFTRDYDARVNAEWLATQEEGPETLVAREYKKGAWISMNQLPDKDVIVLTSNGEKFDVEMSVLALLSPEQYQAAVDGESESPDYLSGLDDFLTSHNVIMLSDGSNPPKTAQSADTDFWYICIPALLLLLVGYICSN